MNEVQRILSEAKALIGTPERWGHPNHYSAVRECYCAQTAIWHAVGCRVPDDEEALAFLSQAIGAPDNRVYRIWHWNDAPERTHAEVMAAFDRAIELAGRSA